MCVRSLIAGVLLSLNRSAIRVTAQGATPNATDALNLARLLFDASALPAGLELESSGSRSEIAQIAGTFRHSRDAAQLLAGWGWVANAYRNYAVRAGAGRNTPARVEISLHRFASSTGAAYALSYFAHDHAVALQQQEQLGDFLLPCDAMVTGRDSATRFLRSGNLVVRATVVMPMPSAAEANAVALTLATDIALAVLARADESVATTLAAC